jgi:hypothetical protein
VAPHANHESLVPGWGRGGEGGAKTMELIEDNSKILTLSFSLAAEYDLNVFYPEIV